MTRNRDLGHQVEQKKATREVLRDAQDDNERILPKMNKGPAFLRGLFGFCAEGTVRWMRSP